MCSVIQVSSLFTAQPQTDTSDALLTCLLQALALQGTDTGALPPADYSSLLLPPLRGHGLESEFTRTCIRCFTKSKEGQGFKHLLIFWTMPHVFPLLKVLLVRLGSWCVCVCVRRVGGGGLGGI